MLSWFKTSPTGRAIVLALVALIVVAALRFVYYELPQQEEIAAKQSGIESLENAADALEDLAKAGGHERVERTAWFPSNYACGIDVTLAEVPEIWKALGFKPGDTSRYQYRLDTTDDGYRIIARTETDCDGIFATYEITGSTNWTSTFTRRATSQNVKE